MADQTLRVEDQPATHDLEFLETQINRYNMAQVGAYDGRTLAIFVRDEAQSIIAGISGYTWAGFCEIKFLWVHEAWRGRGYGSHLLAAAEQEARARGCSLIVLSSYTFQASEFYLRHAYELVGKVENCPAGHTHFYFRKRLL
jgi:GNAT superfamily N-acetyltransferase